MIKYRAMIILALLIFFSACEKPASEDIYIGAVYPVSLRDRDTYLREGIEFAAEKINSEGGVLGRDFHVIIRDDENDAHLAMQIANTMYESGITAVIGHWSTNICYFLEDVYHENEVVMLTPAATGTNLFAGDSRYTYRMGASNEIYSRAIAEYIARQGFSRIAIYFSDDEYGNDFALNIERELTGHGVIVIDRVTSISSASIGTITERWNAFGCDGVIFAALMPEIEEPIRLIRAANNEIPIFGFDNFDRKDFPNDFENIYMAAIDLHAPDFSEEFFARYGHAPDIRAMTGYASVYLIADAMEACGTTDSSAIADFLSGLENHPTIFGLLSYDSYSREFVDYDLSVTERINETAQHY